MLNIADSLALIVFFDEGTYILLHNGPVVVLPKDFVREGPTPQVAFIDSFMDLS